MFYIVFQYCRVELYDSLVMKMSKLPCNGHDAFEKAINDGYKFIDKTMYITLMTDYPVVLLCRPRRFGKSLFTSMLRSYFEGKKNLFKGMAIHSTLSTDEYPVIHFNFSKGNLSLKATLKALVTAEAARHSITLSKTNEVDDLLGDLVINLKKKFGKNVVLLIDDYDHPLQDFFSSEGKNSQRALNTRLDHYKTFFTTVKAL